MKDERTEAEKQRDQLEHRWENAKYVGLRFRDKEHTSMPVMICLKTEEAASWAPVGHVSQFDMNLFKDGGDTGTSLMLQFGVDDALGARIRRCGVILPGDEVVDFAMKLM
jgi:hypothetical protein